MAEDKSIIPERESSKKAKTVGESRLRKLLGKAGRNWSGITSAVILATSPAGAEASADPKDLNQLKQPESPTSLITSVRPKISSELHLPGDTDSNNDVETEALEITPQLVKNELLMIDLMSQMWNHEFLQPLLLEQGIELGELTGDFDAERALIDDSYALSYLIYKLANKYQNHQSLVESATNIALEDLGMETELINNSTAEAASAEGVVKSVVFFRDEQGNAGLRITTDEAKLRQLITTSDQEIINMSFQLGVFEVWLEQWIEKPDPYSKLVVGGEEFYHQYASISIDDQGKIWAQLTEQVQTQGDDDILLKKSQSFGAEFSASDFERAVSLGYVDPQDYTYNQVSDIYFPNSTTKAIYNFDSFYNTFSIVKNVEVTTSDMLTREEYLSLAKEYDLAINPQTVTNEALSQSHAIESLGQLIKLANEFPHKKFVIPGGNVNSDFEEAINILKAHIPANVIIVAGPDYDRGVGRGANISLDHWDINSSSEAVGYVSGLEAWAEVHGINLSEFGLGNDQFSKLDQAAVERIGALVPSQD